MRGAKEKSAGGGTQNALLGTGGRSAESYSSGKGIGGGESNSLTSATPWEINEGNHPLFSSSVAYDDKDGLRQSMDHYCRRKQALRARLEDGERECGRTREILEAARLAKAKAEKRADDFQKEAEAAKVRGWRQRVGA